MSIFLNKDSGVIPTRASSGVMMPGQFGPMIRVFLP